MKFISFISRGVIPKRSLWKILFIILPFINGCIVQYIPSINENEKNLVVEGLITDEFRTNTIKLSRTLPIWGRQFPQPLLGCKVWITDDAGNSYNLKDKKNGSYITDSTVFRGVAGKYYTLHINTVTDGNLTYESIPMEMVPVPPIDKIYYEKKEYETWSRKVEGCQIYLDTHDPANHCKFYRWEYLETWEYHLPAFNIHDSICWISNSSKDIIFLKSTESLAEDKINKYLLNSITDPVDRLIIKYSILIKQYSLNENEFQYWEKIQDMFENSGSLYDKTPASIPNNVFCIEHPEQKVMGFFSVSAMSSKRLFIKDNFIGVNGMYGRCLGDTIFTTRSDTLKDIWIIYDYSHKVPPAVIYTIDRGCIDCSARGTNIKPLFWDDGK